MSRMGRFLYGLESEKSADGVALCPASHRASSPRRSIARGREWPPGGGSATRFRRRRRTVRTFRPGE